MAGGQPTSWLLFLTLRNKPENFPYTHKNGSPSSEYLDIPVVDAFASLANQNTHCSLHSACQQKWQQTGARNLSTKKGGKKVVDERQNSLFTLSLSHSNIKWQLTMQWRSFVPVQTIGTRPTWSATWNSKKSGPAWGDVPISCVLRSTVVSMSSLVTL